MSDAIAVNDPANGYRPRRSHHHNGSVSVGLTHAKVARPPTPAAKPKPAAAVAPPIANAPSPVGRIISNYADVLEIFRARADELEVSRLELDYLSGLASGYASVLLAKTTTPRKIFGPVSLGRILDALGLRLLVVEDASLTERTLKRRTKRVTTHAHYPRQLPAPNPLDDTFGLEGHGYEGIDSGKCDE